VSFRERQMGRRPDSPMGTQRPYSPAVKTFVPVASSFEDLSAIPSPHALKESNSFGSLEFAPPLRFRGNIDGGGSDVASIRSGRSGRSAALSPMHAHNIRAGAYRISKVPKELAGTKQDIVAGLRPTWDLRGPA